MKRIFILLSLSLCLQMGIQAQKTAIYRDPEAKFKEAIELTHKQKYGAAQKLFYEVQQSIENTDALLYADAQYYIAYCAAQLYNKDADYEFKKFIQAYPSNSKISLAYFNLGTFYYEQKNYKEALANFTEVKTSDLDAAQLDEYNFKLGYCYFMSDKFAEAKPYLEAAKNGNTKYSIPATYYYGHIAYAEKRYDAALKCFTSLKDDPTFGEIVPYYIAQIYFLQDNHDKLIEVAKPLLDKASAKRMPEIAHMIGTAYYTKSDFPNSIKYLEIYAEKAPSLLTSHDYYQLGYAYYTTGKYKQAIEQFKMISDSSEMMMQNTYYHMAMSYIKAGDKVSARTFFATASKMNADAKVKEDALFNYAKVSYELSMNPYNEAIDALQQYINEYPNSRNKDEIHGFLADIYMSTKNYKEALVSLEKITYKDAKLYKAYQRICYNRGVELFNENKYDEALDLFNKAIEKNYNQTLYLESMYWKGEILYRKEKYTEAEPVLKNFYFSDGAKNVAEYNMANYTLGYTYLKIQRYSDANFCFKRFLSNISSEPKNIVNDVYVRLGDSYYILKEYNPAIENYTKAVERKSLDADYAMYQKAISQGALNNFESKIGTLEKLIANYSQSTYVAPAKYEIANTYLLLDKGDKASMYFNDLVKNHPSSSYVKTAMFKTGLVQYQQSNYDDALVTFKSIVSKYPGTPEARNSIETIRNIYAAMNQIDDFFAYAKDIHFVNVSETEKDSLTYATAENFYMNGDCNNASKGFKNYIEKYQNGFFINAAHYYLADCEYKSGDFESALKHYDFASNKVKNTYTEKSLQRAADICYNKKDYRNAAVYFEQLEKIAEVPSVITSSQIGSMKCHYYLSEYDKALAAAQKLLPNEKAMQQMHDEIYLVIANSSSKLSKMNEAAQAYEAIKHSKNGDIQGEAIYNLAQMAYGKGDLEGSEKIIFAYISDAPSNDYWLASCYILWADIYSAKGNTFQAKQTLQSIVENYDGEDLKNVAKAKLQQIETKEKEEAAKRKQEKEAREKVESSF